MTAPYTLSLISTPPVNLTPYAAKADPSFTGTATFAGSVQLAAGSLAAPSLSFSSDADTGFCRPANDQMTLVAGGGAVFRAAAVTGQVNNLVVFSGASGAPPVIAAEGADANIGLRLMSKGSMQDSSDILLLNGAGRSLARFGSGTGGTIVNSLLVRAQSSGQPVQIYAEGNDASIDLALYAKGSTGRIRFGTFTVGSDAPVTGFIEIRDGSGALRKLAVIA
ncbi:hypothetical protein Sp245p_27070 (plasmid) [Azospirillum baldaniorum]|uniref:Uncharacterized protein n=2 Tax=Azospirillum TaxID=191 RepID=B6RFH1_AZOBR|nr:hypothetical protein [Azospirillum baldaniorum]TWA70290.1 hypothetical protein FBZ85_12513 [Azospirillum brasilense]ABY66543.1 hypothetical protein [Azospirillum baldaniorum]AWJ93410.1 hypothetical protein Sp245p_26465 [Azospirillum baldaniorum]AWJ93520.1 hypothetical protein Sp245p_27070 [Azospirillum baldaniorum]CCD04042.1 conserved protein of unknown function [Azospirillum baldaniorum]